MGIPCLAESSFAATSAPVLADMNTGFVELFAIIAILSPLEAGAAAGACFGWVSTAVFGVESQPARRGPIIARPRNRRRNLKSLITTLSFKKGRVSILSRGFQEATEKR
jgi:hypothetical protein